MVLTHCNHKLTQWDDYWRAEMDKGLLFFAAVRNEVSLTHYTARGEKFHYKFLTFFRLHVRLFLNSFGIQAALHPVSQTVESNNGILISMFQHNRQPPSIQALTSCSTSAYETLHIVAEDFHGMKLLVSVINPDCLT